MENVDVVNPSGINGKTVIDDSVVAKLTGIAIREIPGVHALGGGAARVAGAIRGVVGNTDHAQGVSVEVGEQQVAADISVVAEYPVALQELSDRIREAAAKAIIELVGMDVAEVNVTINDVHVQENDDEDEEPRVS
ncbi:Asp23/Gls24 family envelope stress response protein [Canibacter zhoujuaniae]|uniref:Asp23/Gls24 family envelope stress response protein n=1 Tax=Canibacter zhoujuaniae TaxID=2708343 RepID=UPI0014200FFB|nr:Asp23/Gls24 family envelope stress response protein [Canibacter zhoujuaniae]